jgi:hypothetical protein
MIIDKLADIDPYIALGIFFLVVGIIVFILNTRAIVLANASKHWDITKGIILESVLYISDTDESNTYRPQIEYSYSINENDFKSNRVYFGSNILSSFKKRRSQRLINKYPKGKCVDVYFNRMNEKMSVLEPGIKTEIITGLVLGIVLLAIGYLFYSYPEAISILFNN